MEDPRGQRLHKTYGSVGELIEGLAALRDLGFRDITVTTVTSRRDDRKYTDYLLDASENAVPATDVREFLRPVEVAS